MKFEKLKVQPLNLDRFMPPNLPENRVALMGIELEGGWVKAKLANNVRPEPDGSVFKEARKADPYWLQSKGCDLSGEIVSKPMLPAGVPAWMRKFYPFFVDKTCGLHVHMSFESMKNYERLMVPEFPITMLEYLKRWANKQELPPEHPLWDRLADQSKYCQHKFWPDEQVRLERLKSAEYYDQDRKGSRYTVINYCYRLHGTMECRILPMFESVNLSISAVELVRDVTNASLVVLARRDEIEKGKVSSQSDTFEEHYDIHV